MRKVEVAIDIDTASSRVISAFTDPNMLRDWWEVERTCIQTKEGGVYVLAWRISDSGFGFLATGIIKEYHPETILAIDNFVYMNPEKELLGPMTLTIRARQFNKGSSVYICQDGYQEGKDWDWYYNAVKEAWPVVAQTLKTYLEQRG